MTVAEKDDYLSDVLADFGFQENGITIAEFVVFRMLKMRKKESDLK